MKMLTRRTVLLAAAGVAVLGLVGGLAVQGRLTGARKIIVRVLHRYFGEERLAVGAAEQFADDFAPSVNTKNSGSAIFIASPAYSLDWVRRLFPAERAEKLEDYEREIITAFVVSSDIMPDGALPGPRLAYRGLVDYPTCSRFARLRS